MSAFRSIADIVVSVTGAPYPAEDERAALAALRRTLPSISSADEHRRIMDAIVALQTAAPATDSALSAHFQKEEARRVDPWRTAYEGCVRRAANIAKSQTLESCRSRFQATAKAKALTPDQALFLFYILYGDEQARIFIAMTILQSPEDDARPQRVRAHNFHVAHTAGEGFLEQYGAQVANLQFPLFPVETEFELLNQILCSSAPVTDPVGGAPPPPRQWPDVFRKPAESSDPRGWRVLATSTADPPWPGRRRRWST
eukprot:PhM_4_TR10066/c4_g1_i4/m.25785